MRKMALTGAIIVSSAAFSAFPLSINWSDRNLNCQACGAPLPARDGQFVLKYFLLRKPSRP